MFAAIIKVSNNLMKLTAYIALLVLNVALVCCKKDNYITSQDARLEFSADTVRFDTVFTTVGSITQSFKIFNENDQKLHLRNIMLKGGTASSFKINVNGTIGPEVRDIDIEANDSIYVFVSVMINQGAGNLPFVIQDSIEITYNNNKKFVQLESWGQNANFLRSRLITGRVTWTAGLPYVILGGVLIDTNAVLTIQKGSRIYLHADAPMIVDGTLLVNGEKYDSTRVYFRSDRLDNTYRDLPAGWPGIYFRGSSKSSVLNYAVIQNAYQAVVTEKPSSTAEAKVTLNQCIIDNAYDAGILALESSVKASNCLISNCGKNIQLAYGGNYQFDQCTVVSYSGIYQTHKEPVLFLSNNTKQDNTVLTADLTANFRNCIFWGEGGALEDEVVSSKQGNTVFAVNISNSLWKVKTAPANVTASAVINGQSPAFDSVNTQKNFFNFRLKSGSPVIDKGVSTGLLIDLDGRPRAVNLPDLGAYEKQ